MIVEEGQLHEVLFGGAIQDRQSFLRFGNSQITKLPDFFSSETVAKKNLLGGRISEAEDHREFVTDFEDKSRLPSVRAK